MAAQTASRPFFARTNLALLTGIAVLKGDSVTNQLVRMFALMSFLCFASACSKASFDGTDVATIADKSSNDSSGLELEDDDQSPVGDDDEGNDDNSNDGDKKYGVPVKKEDDHKDCKKDDDDDSKQAAESSDPYVACYLSSNSKWKLGIANGQLAMVTSVSNSICIPKSVCLNEVGAMFGISVAADRGYCGKNPNVLMVSKSQFENL